MRVAPALAAAAALAAGAAALLPGAVLARPAEERPGAEDPARVFGERCASCHAVPDPDLRTDRAWLDQVRRTA